MLLAIFENVSQDAFVVVATTRRDIYNVNDFFLIFFFFFSFYSTKKFSGKLLVASGVIYGLR